MWVRAVVTPTFEGAGDFAMIDRRKFLYGGVAMAGGLVGWSLASSSSIVDVREHPHVFAPQPFVGLNQSVDSSVAHLVRDRLRLYPDIDFSGHLHWLRTFGNPGRPDYKPTETAQVVSLLTSAQQIEDRFRQADVIVRSRDGVRYATRRSGLDLNPKSAPAHRFQELAVFGEIGLPSSSPVYLNNQTATLKDVINDCLANLQLRDSTRQEPEWPTQVIAHYVLPEIAWKNRWGEHITVDEWVRFLLQRHISKFSCGGTHMIHTMALLLQAHRRHPVLSASSHNQVVALCREFSSMLEKTQHDDGSWIDDWHESSRLPLYNSQEKMGMHLTGHIMEAELFMPSDLRISHACADAALRYLARAYRICTDEEVRRNYCIFSHAGNALLTGS